MWAVKKEKECEFTFTFFSCNLWNAESTRRATSRPESTRVLASGGDGRSLTGQLYSGMSEVGSFADIVDVDIQRASPPAGLFTAFRLFFRFRVSDDRGACVRVSERHACQLRFQRFTTIYVFPLLFFSFFPLFYEGLHLGAGPQREERRLRACARDGLAAGVPN